MIRLKRTLAEQQKKLQKKSAQESDPRVRQTTVNSVIDRITEMQNEISYHAEYKPLLQHQRFTAFLVCKKREKQQIFSEYVERWKSQGIYIPTLGRYRNVKGLQSHWAKKLGLK